MVEPMNEQMKELNLQGQQAQKITKEYVMNLKKPTDRFLCPLSANHYNIQFLNFTIRDTDSDKIFFQISREQQQVEQLEQVYAMLKQRPELDTNFRTIKYKFGTDFFKIKSIGTALVFSIGDKPVKNFTMIERHYFRDQLIKSFEFTFPFCIPNTTNSWEAIYELPQLDEKLKQEMIENEYETKSDSFYFVGDEFIMHNKAEYSYL